MSAYIRHFTVSCYIIEQEKVLLLYHPKHQKWLPPGGHLEKDEIPEEGVIREVLEETGLHVELFSDEELWIEEWNARSLVRPYLCLLEKIPAHGTHPAHEHIDLIYVGRPVGGALNADIALRWFTLAEVLALTSDVEIFLETQKAIQHLLHRVEDFVGVQRP